MQFFSKERITLSLIVILIMLSIFLGGQYYIAQQNARANQLTLEYYQHNEKVLSFTKMFFSKVLMADGAVSFDDRLALENAVRDINDKTIYEQWKNFIAAKDQADAQVQVRELLGSLIFKIQY